VDPSFERQTPPALGGWITFGAWYSKTFARKGQWSVFEPTYYGVVGSFEQLPAVPGSQWRLTGYGLTPYPLMGAPAFGIVQFSFFDAFGNDLGTVETAGTGTRAKTSNPLDGNSPSGVWTLLDTGPATAPAGAAFIQAFTLYVDFSGYQQGVYFDTLKLSRLDCEDDQ
jgi:hypothetical protein